MVSDILEVVLKFVVLVGLIFLVFGYSYLFFLFDIYGGKILSSGEGDLDIEVLYNIFWLI